jgi:hypothetical protein
MSEQGKLPAPGSVRREVRADETTRRGVYANEAIVAHGREEFTLDFCFFSSLHPRQGQLVSRVIVSPGLAKRLLHALQENVRRYEERLGEIRIAVDPAGEEPPVVQ